MASILSHSPVRASLIVVAGGLGLRMGGGVKKEFLQLDGQPVLLRALGPFLNTGLFETLTVVVTSSFENEAAALISPFTDNYKIEVLYVTGGETRQESVLNGLMALKSISPDIVLIHDGARPWISKEVIHAVYQKAVESDAAIPVIPSVNALKEIDEDGIITRSIDRSKVVGAQTPQGFGYNDLLTAHLKAAADRHIYLDDAEIYTAYIGRVYTVAGDVRNKKITYKEDIEG